MARSKDRASVMLEKPAKGLATVVAPAQTCHLSMTGSVLILRRVDFALLLSTVVLGSVWFEGFLVAIGALALATGWLFLYSP
jgi:hypothetical protein